MEGLLTWPCGVGVLIIYCGSKEGYTYVDISIALSPNSINFVYNLPGNKWVLVRGFFCVHDSLFSSCKWHMHGAQLGAFFSLSALTCRTSRRWPRTFTMRTSVPRGSKEVAGETVPLCPCLSPQVTLSCMCPALPWPQSNMVWFSTQELL